MRKRARCKKQKARLFVGASEIESELGNPANSQTNPEGRAQLTRRLVVDLVFESSESATLSVLVKCHSSEVLNSSYRAASR